MRIERTKNAVRNIVFGVILKLYQIVAPFILRTAMIYFLGMEYLGLNSLFTSILSVLNLAELGVGTAMVFSMYKPIAEDNKEEICALMQLYKVYYRIIGIVVLIGGIVVTPFLTCLVKGDIPADINIYLIFALNLMSTVLSYWLYAYKSCLFSAHQRGDITSKISMIISTLTYVLQFIVLFLFRNYYVYLMVGIITQIVQNVMSAAYASRLYPEYQAKGVLSDAKRKDINQRARDLFTSKVGGVVLNSADTIVISAFLGITVLAIYNNYYYIMSSVIGFLEIIFYACTAGIGNSIITETKEKNYNDFGTLTFLIAWVACVCSCCFLNLYQPFLYIWMNGDVNKMLPFEIVICLCVYFFVYELNRVANVYKDAAGIWHEDRFRPIVTAMVNLVLNLILVQYIGLFGILLSTVIATVVVNCPWLYSKLFKTVFEQRRLKSYVGRVLTYSGICFLVVSCSYFVCRNINVDGIIGLFIRLVTSTVISNVLLVIVYYRLPEFQRAKGLVFGIINRFKRKEEKA